MICGTLSKSDAKTNDISFESPNIAHRIDKENGRGIIIMHGGNKNGCLRRFQIFRNQNTPNEFFNSLKILYLLVDAVVFVSFFYVKKKKMQDSRGGIKKESRTLL